MLAVLLLPGCALLLGPGPSATFDPAVPTDARIRYATEPVTCADGEEFNEETEHGAMVALAAHVLLLCSEDTCGEGYESFHDDGSFAGAYCVLAPDLQWWLDWECPGCTLRCTEDQHQPLFAGGGDVGTFEGPHMCIIDLPADP